MPVVIDGFTIDVAKVEQHSFENEVTSFPVEKGADVTDHVRARPISVSIDGVVSNTPIGSRSEEGEGDGKLPVDDALAHLRSLRERREPVTIETNLGRYEDMILQSLYTPQDATTGLALRFSAVFVQLALVSTERTTIRVKIPAAKAKVNLGQKTSPEVAALKPTFDPEVDSHHVRTITHNGQPALLNTKTYWNKTEAGGVRRVPTATGGGPTVGGVIPGL